MRKLFSFASAILLTAFFGCQKPIKYLDPILPDPAQPLSPFVQQVPWWMCAPSRVGNCGSQQVFSWTVPNVKDSDSLRVVFWWFAGKTLSPSQVPTVQDSTGSLYTLIQYQVDFSGQKYGYIFNTPAVRSGGSNVVVTVTLPFPCPNWVDLDALEYQAAFNADGRASNGNSQFLSPQAGPVTVSTNSDVLLSIYFGTMSHVSACSACSVRYNSTLSNFIVQDYLPPSPGTYTATFPDTPNSVGYWGVVAASFQ